MRMRSLLFQKSLSVCCAFLLTGCLFVTGCASRNTTDPMISDVNSVTPSPIATPQIIKNTIPSENSSKAGSGNTSIMPIYFSVFPSQIWQISPKDHIPQIVHEIAPNDTSVTDIFPPTELAQLQNYLTSHSITTTVQEMAPTFVLQKLSLSPSKDTLVWLESDIYMQRDDPSGGFGVFRLATLNLDTKEINYLWQIPLHNADQIIQQIHDGPIWSPDGKYIALSYQPRDVPLPASLVVINTYTKELQEIAGPVDMGAPIRWSPDSTTIATELSRWHTQASGAAIRLYTLNSGNYQEIELDNLWVRDWSMDWSPNDAAIVFSGYNQNESEATALYLLDSGAGMIQEIPLKMKGLLENPQWSPDGQFLACNYRTGIEEYFQALLIVEPASGKIVNQLQLDRVESAWNWIDDDNILILLGTDRFKLEIGILNIHNGSLQKIQLPEELTTKGITNLN